MKRVLVLGAGQSSPYLIRTLLEEGGELFVDVRDRDVENARKRLGDAENGAVTGLDAQDQGALRDAIAQSDVVVNLLAPMFQVPVARLCVELKRSMVSASYRDPELLALEPEAKARGVTLASELGLDPGLDHMSSMRLLGEIERKGEVVESYYSYGSGVVDRATVPNPLGYAITWNPRNVVRAGAAGARFLEAGRERVVPYPRVLDRTWTVEVPGVGPMEAYANRDSLPYVDLYGVGTAETVVRATLRFPGFCETWLAIARLGLAGDEPVPSGAETWRDLVESCLAPGEGDLGQRVARQLGLHPNGRALDNLRWLGLFDEEALPSPRGRSFADVMVDRLQARLALPEGGRDLVILFHEIRTTGAAPQRYRSVLVVKGEEGMTAMAKTVGLPAALATLDLLGGTFPLYGCPIPTERSVFERILPKVEARGLVFEESQRAMR